MNNILRGPRGRPLATGHRTTIHLPSASETDTESESETETETEVEESSDQKSKLA